MENTGLKAVLWDMDGVLVDSNELHFRAWQAMYREFNGAEQVLTREAFDAIFGMRNTETIIALFGTERATPEFIATVRAAKEKQYRASLPGNLHPLAGVLSWLAYFQDRGIRQAVASSASERNIDAALQEIDAARYFEAIVAGESASISRSKPAPDVFLEAARRLEVESKACLVVEDSVHGVQAAAAAGMRCLAITSTNTAAALRQADWIIDDFTEMTPEQLLALFQSPA